MSPSFPTARPVWVWSFPAIAIILSFLWYRKKRGSLKTDSGGAGEAPNGLKRVESEEELTGESEEVVEECADVVEEVKEAKSVEEVAGVAEPEAKEERKGSLEVEVKAKKEEVKEVVKKEEVKKVEAKEEKVEEKAKEVEEKAKEVEEQFVEAEEEKEGSRGSEEEAEAEAALVKAIEESVISEEGGTGSGKCGRRKRSKEMAKKSNDSGAEQRQGGEETAACILEQKLAKLDIASERGAGGAGEKRGGEDVAERDSANNSPSEVMLTSPSVSGYSDTHSEGSSDSGKGCSEMLTPSRTPASGNSVSGDLPLTSIYEFVIPQQLVGRLIGRHGCYVNEIKETTHASIYIKRHPDTTKLKICAVEGSQMDIESALEMIRRKFPKKRYPSVTLEQVVISREPQMIPIISEQMQLYLIEGINNDVILSSLVSAGHFFLQQPTHPTYLSLNRLNQCMMYCYSEPDQPTLPEGVGAGILCAAPVHNGWYRAQIVSMDAEGTFCDVKFVDYGGYMSLPVSALRQIRVDFVNLPFQAAECYLAGVKPANEENVWCEKAKELVEKLTFGKVLQAQVYGYAEDSVPLIYLYTRVDDEFILINQELVERGLAEWLYSEAVTEEVQEMGGGELEESGPMAVAV